MISAIITAAGRGTRMGAAENKIFIKICGKTVLEHTAAAFYKCSDIDEIIVTAAYDEINRCRDLLRCAPKPVKVVLGGKTRQESVRNGILVSSGDFVLIHDGARALITPELIKKAADACRKYGAAALGVPVKDTLKRIGTDGIIEETIDRSCVYQVQTPQSFSMDLIKSAHERAKDISATDDCSLVEAMGIKIKMVMGSYENIKLTTPEDLIFAKAVLEMRKGI